MRRLQILLLALGVPAIAQVIPQITSLSPVSIPAGSAAFTLTVSGGPFNNCAQVLWDGTPRTTTFVNTTTLTAAIPATLLTTPRIAAITARNFNSVSTPCDQATTPSASASFFITALPLSWQTNPQLPSGTQNVTYQTTLLATGGLSPVNYAIATGSTAPPGLTLASNGTLGGTPLQAGTYTFTVTAADSCPSQTGYCTPASANRTFSLTIAPPANPLVITTSTLPPANACALYSTTIAAANGTAPYSWSAVGLPQGFALNAQTGVLSGTVTTSGSYQVTVTVRDTASATAVSTFTLQVGASTLAITNTTLPGARVGTVYSGALAATGGTAPYSFYVSSDAVPGLAVTVATGAIGGTPTQAGTFGSIFLVRDANSCQALKTLPIAVQPPALSITTPQAPQGFQDDAYGAQFQSAGGSGQQRTWSIAGGSLPPGLTLNPATGLVSGTPTAAGSFSFDLRVSDGTEQATKPFTIVILAALTITTQTLPAGSLCSTYSTTVSATGGLPPYAWSATGLPTGLNINSQTGVISGTATAAGSSTVVVSVRDQAKENAVLKTFTLVFNASNLSITTATLPGATVGTPYSATLAASGGTTPYSFSLGNVNVPGLSVSQAGVISGTPTQAGTYNVIFVVTDAGQCQVTKTLQIVVAPSNPLTITTLQLPLGFRGEAYGPQLQATGGTGQLTWSISTGALPAGLTLNAATGLISGTPTVSGTFTIEIRVMDVNEQVASRTYSLQIIEPITISTATLPAGSSCATYSAQMTATGGVPPLVWSASGLPAGLSIDSATGLITGTVNTSGTFNVVIFVRDQAKENPAQKAFTLTLNVSTLAILTAALPNGSPNVAYSAALTATGGSPGYTFALEANGVPGLAVDANGNITGTPIQAGVFNPTFRVTDSLGCIATRTIPLTIGTGLAPTISTVVLTPARVNQPYSFQIQAAGGSGQRTWTLPFGALPSGLILDATNGIISGTPLVAGDFTFQLRLTDAAGSDQRLFTLTVAPPILITTDILPAATQNRAYSAVVTATGGTAPLRFGVPDLPQGLTIDTTTGSISGIPVVLGTFTITVQVTDAVGLTSSKTLSLIVNPELRIVTDTLPNGQTGTLYNQTLAAVGGLPPYTWSQISPPDLPRGITLNSQTGQLLGTPTVAADLNVRFRVTDQNNTQVEKLIRLSVRPSFFIQTDTLPEANRNEPYTATLMATGGAGPITWRTEGNTPPPGLSLSVGGVLSGTPTEAGGFTLNVVATDNAGNEARKTYSFIVRGVLTITPDTIIHGEMGVDYRQAFSVTGTQTGVSLLLSAGTLPDGLRLEPLDRTANLLGTPTRLGTFHFTLRATDATGQVATRNYTIDIAERLVISTATLPRGGQGDPFDSTLAGTGGNGTYTWSLQSGPLPAGLQFDSATGAITGTPTQSGNFNLSFQLSDGLGRQTTKVLALRVTPILQLAPDAAGTATVGVPFSQTFASTNATGAASFTIVEGRLPAGLTLNAATGLLSGVPTESGTFNITLEATDSEGARGRRAYVLATVAFPSSTITILPAEVPPAGQQPVTVGVASPFPTVVDGVVRLTFVSEDGGPADPAMGLNTADRRTATFRLPAGQTQAAFPANLMLQSGTVAGTITLTLTLTANGVDVTPVPAPRQVIRILAAAPVIDTITARRSGNSITVEVVGFATGREVTSAEYQFTGGANVAQTSFTVQTGSVIRAWFQDARAAEFGSLFKLTMPFTITGDAAQITQVSVTLVNATGRSTARQANVQ